MPQTTLATASTPFTALYCPKVYSYARWSTPEQAKGDSFRRQDEAARKWADRRGLELDQSLRITDEGVSAYRGNNALDGGLSRFLEACRRGLIEAGSYLLVESLDRISRMAPRRAQRLIDDIVDNEVTIVTLNDEQEYTAKRLDEDPMALIIAIMVAWRAHDESKTKGRRVRAAWQEKRRRVRETPTERLTRRAPAWLVAVEDRWELDPLKANTIRRIFALTLAGDGEHRIAGRFNQEGVPVLGRGSHWHRSTIAKVLRNPAVIGTLQPGFMTFEGGRKRRELDEPIADHFPPVISHADWLAVRALKDGKAAAVRGRHAGKGVAHLFAGLAKCPACGATMTRVNKGGRSGGLPKLVCTVAKGKAGCKYSSVSVAGVEAAFSANWGNLFANVPAGDTSCEGLDATCDGLQATIGGREDHLSDLCRVHDAAPSASNSRAMAKVEAELRTLRAQLAETETLREMADHGLIHDRMSRLADLLEPQAEVGGAEEIDSKAVNAALKVLFSAVVVDYVTGFLRFRWRQGGEASICYAWVG